MTATRREFLKVAAAAGASLTIGFRLYAVDDDAAATLFKPNAWLQLDADGGIVLTVGKSEMGQGVRTTLPMILADELDADWTKIKLVQAMPGPDFQRLGTGGSGSTSGSWNTLRTAGAAAREMLVATAAARWGVEASECRTRNSVVTHEPSGRTLPYRSLVADAAGLPVPESPKLKSAAGGEIRVTRIVAAVDCGVAVNPLGIEAQIESGVVWALSMALKGFMEWRDGSATAENFHDYEVLHLHETPVIETHIVASEGDSPYGMGEPTVCPVVPAVANAILAATGQRLRRLPFALEKAT